MTGPLDVGRQAPAAASALMQTAQVEEGQPSRL
jgi:hypothetical protein